MPTVNKCCCGCDLKTGTIIIGVFSLVIIMTIIVITIIIIAIIIIISADLPLSYNTCGNSNGVGGADGGWFWL